MVGVGRAQAQAPSDDEASFQRKEQRRQARDTALLNPIILGALIYLYLTIC